MANIKDPEDRRILSNYRFRPRVIEKLKKISFRRSVAAQKTVSSSSILEDLVEAAEMPPAPRPQQIAAYEAATRERKRLRT